MKLQFDSNQDYQLQAIQSIVDLFEGQPLSKGEYEFSFAQAEGSLTFTEFGVGNKISLSVDAMLENLKRIQERNSLTASLKLEGKNFSVEMETGTGKTYVYLRTIYELNKKYGFKKFIVVVPSIAIREGVLKNLEITHEHFQMLYNKVSLSFFVYDSKNVSLLRGFATSNTIQVLVINIDSFAKDDNIINKNNDKLTGKRPIEFIQHTNPIVIVDEPQNMETPIRKKAIQSLNPCCTLRYSATHTELYNQVYRLGPVQAYDLGLVKQIEVDSVVTEQSYNQAFIKLESIKSLPTKVTAKVSLDCNSDDEVKRKAINVKVGDNLHELSNHREMYKDGYIVDEIDATEKTLSFTNGIKLFVGNVLGDFQDEIMKVQIRKTVEEHFKKELKMRDKGIKVLSLFFIDKVKNYRTYEGGTAGKGKFADWFEQTFTEFSKKPEYKELLPYEVEKVHNGYFAQDKKGILKDSREGRSSEDDEHTYNLIMKDKERLLDVSEPLRFIFSHSALREGWDNPNVFQLCTLNETKSELKKRQEIGRGLRLSVASDGNRVFDKNINRLTVVANESYEDFAKQLQTEIERETGDKFEGRIKKKEDKVAVRLKKGYEMDEAFKKLWERIRQKTTYKVQYDTDELVKEAVRRIKEISEIKAPRIIFQRTELQMVKEGIKGETKQVKAFAIDSPNFVIPDLVGYIRDKTHLTRGTIHRILKESGRLGDALKNPQLFLDAVVKEINSVLAKLMVDGIKYQKIADECYEMRLFEDDEIEQYIDALYQVRKHEKTLYNYISIDSMSEPEKKFAKDCEDNNDIEFFMKLPRGFYIDTPIGKYRPDWALVLKEEKRLYFVAETKSSLHYDDMRSNEWQKVKCGYKHFDEFEDVKFKHVTKLSELE